MGWRKSIQLPSKEKEHSCSLDDSDFIYFAWSLRMYLNKESVVTGKRIQKLFEFNVFLSFFTRSFQHNDLPLIVGYTSVKQETA